MFFLILIFNFKEKKMAKRTTNFGFDERTHEGLKRAAVLMGTTMSALAESFIRKCGQEKYLESQEALKGKNLDADFKAFHKKQLDAYEVFNEMGSEEHESLGGE